MKSLILLTITAFATILAALMPPAHSKAQSVKSSPTYSLMQQDTLLAMRKTDSIRVNSLLDSKRNDINTDKIILAKEKCAEQLAALRRENSELRNKLHDSETVIAEMMTKEPSPKKRTWLQGLFHKNKKHHNL